MFGTPGNFTLNYPLKHMQKLKVVELASLLLNVVWSGPIEKIILES
jgi:hypothetical protein